MDEKKEQEIVLEIKNPELILLTIFLAAVFILESIITLNSPIAFGDEGHHTTLAEYMGKNLVYPIWEPTFGTPIQKLGFHQKPLWNILEGSFVMIFRVNIVKILVPFIGSILLGLAVFVLVLKFYDKITAFIASVTAVTLPTMVTYSMLVYTDALFTLYFSLFVLTFILAFKTDEKKYWLTTAVFASLSLLTKNPGYVIFPFFILAFLYSVYQNRSLFKPLKRFSLIVIIVLLIVGSFFFRSYVYYGTPDCYLTFIDTRGCSKTEIIESEYKYEYEARTVETGSEVNIFRMGIISYFDFVYGIIWFVPFGVVAGLLVLFYRKSLPDMLIFILFISSIPILYVGGQGRVEDLARYTLGFSPFIAIIAARYFEELYRFFKKHDYFIAGLVLIGISFVILFFGMQNDPLRIAGILILLFLSIGCIAIKKYKYLALAVVIILLFFSFQNAITKVEGMKYVKAFNPSFLEACDWIKKNLDKDARIAGTIWVSAGMYNCDRNFGGGGPELYSNNISIILPLLKRQNVTHLFIQKFSINYEDKKFQEMYPISFVKFLENNPDYFEKIYENGPSLSDCESAGGCTGNIVYKIKY